MDYSLQKLAKLYISEIVRLHRIPILHLDSRKSFTRHWVLVWILVLFSIRKLTNNLNNWEEHLPLSKFSYNNRFQSSIEIAPYEALYGRKYQISLCWTELGEKKILGLEVKSYADLKRKDIDYSIRDQVFLKVSPWRKDKSSLKFIGPYKILKRVDPMAYQLELPLEVDQIHDVFYVSILRRY
ncbi:DNA/RNA polymerases superfamily protein [Gossypium australe]|uniref:DNA/RNA polymerases superfamily protein n=1 Tax=Gossypium australe TaxID=47621 RepID=A0A5B6WBY3_9ROSI|nr:DNA/RNA polymerases superfamily protein [Gossypium australe]